MGQKLPKQLVCLQGVGCVCGAGALKAEDFEVVFDATEIVMP